MVASGSEKLMVRKNAILARLTGQQTVRSSTRTIGRVWSPRPIPSLGGPECQTLSNRSGTFKPGTKSQHRRGELAAAEQRPPSRSRAVHRDGVDFGDQLLNRNRPAMNHHLAGELPDALARTLQRHQQPGLHLRLSAGDLALGQSLSGVGDLLDNDLHQL